MREFIKFYEKIETEFEKLGLNKMWKKDANANVVELVVRDKKH